MHRKSHQKQPSPPYPFAVLCISLVLCFQPHARSRTRNACSASSREPPASTTAGLLPAASTGSSSSGSARGTSPAGAAEQGDRRDLTGGSRTSLRREQGGRRAVAGGAAEEDVRERPSASGCGRLRPPRGPTVT